MIAGISPTNAPTAGVVGALVLGEALNGTQVLALGVAVLGVLLATLPTRWLRAR